MPAQIALVYKPRTLSEKWKEYLEKNKVSFRLINVFESNLKEQLDGIRLLLWSFDHTDYQESLIAASACKTAENLGIEVYPNHNERFFYNDKLTQAIYFNSIGLPIPETKIYYELSHFSTFLKNAQFPFIIKLRKGAGSENVFFIRSTAEAKKLSNKLFHKGISVFRAENYIKKRIKKERNLFSLPRIMRRSYLIDRHYNKFPKESGYVLVQEHIQNEGFDYRVVVTGKRAYVAKRIVLQHQFGASGSGLAEYPNEDSPQKLVEIAFNIHQKMNTRCMSYDFLQEADSGKFYLIEANYTYAHTSMDPCKGYFDSDLTWHFSDEKPDEHLIHQLILNQGLN